MAAGKSMALILSDTSIGTQEAAEFLEVSRPYVVRGARPQLGVFY
jgi:hypothetical protein